ncbi:site-2 protease family protein [Halobaculum lipolyticum]|uniref:Site-2 protease family protein n=1 Tax=Halobaculum lipolyticum TaxID=3032001 RepID=A0ABD5WAH3_9EURY|nr:site-2 protease family protein [Halobaculum sp. DT31]
MATSSLLSNTLLWVLVGILAYSVVMMGLYSRGYLPDAVRVQGPLTTIHTKRGRTFLNWLSRPRRLWRAWSNLGVGIAVVVMVAMFGFLVFSALATLQSPVQTAANQPSNFLIIPGVNDFLPLAVAPEIVFGLLVALVVHEGGHGLLCRVEDIDIDSLGVVLLALIPVGAFVEPDEESQSNADRGARSRMFAAGVTNNFAVTAVVFALLFGPVIASITPAAGLAVGGAYQGAPAADAGIESGDRITAVAGQSVADPAAFESALAAVDDPTVEMTLADGETVAVERRVTAVGAVDGNPLGLSVDPEGEPPAITAVAGTEVRTEAEFRAAARDHEFATVTTTEGTVEAPLGAYVGALTENGALDNQTDLAAPFTITRIDGERIVDYDDLTTTLSGDTYDPGDEVTLRLYAADGFEEVTVALGGTDANPLIGVSVVRGVSGVVVDDLGIERYPAEAYLALLGGDAGDLPPGFGGIAGSPLGLVYAALLLPLASAVSAALPYNFAGFYGRWAGFYDVTGPLGALGEGPVFLLANVLFWTGWINIQLGIFNCIPGYPLDGGRLLRMGAEGLVSRLPVSDRSRVVSTLTTSVGLTMLAALLVVVFAPSVL